MFLNYINYECREDVMDLAIYVALANKVIEKSEEESLNQYFHELGLEKRELAPKNSLEETIKKITLNTNFKEKKMIMFELVALAYVDGECDDKEEKLLSEIIKSFGIKNEDIDSMNLLIIKLRNIYNEIGELLGKEE